MSSFDRRLERLPLRLVVVSGLAMAATWIIQKAITTASPSLLREIATAENAEQVLAASPLQAYLNAVSFACGLIALPGLVRAWHFLSSRAPKARSMFVVILAVAWPALAGVEFTFHRFGTGAFPLHDLVVGAPFITAVVAAIELGNLRSKGGGLNAWTISAYALTAVFFILPRVVKGLPETQPDRFMIVSVGGLALLAVVVGAGLLVALLGWTLPMERTPPDGALSRPLG